MKLEVHLNGPTGKQTRIVGVERNDDRWRISLDGIFVDANVVQVAPNVLSILLQGRSIEVRIQNSSRNGILNLQCGLQEFTAEVIDPRIWRGRRHGALEAEGRQQIVAPMPGKIIRILAQPGDSVEAGQGLLVIEAMKMQNEIRSPKKGAVERILVKEGQTVNAGEILAVVS